MVNFPFVSVFSFIMIFGTFFSLSSAHWFGVWVGLELNLLGFIPMMVQSGKSEESEAAVKYFLVQAAGSALLLLGVMMLNYSFVGWEYALGGSYLGGGFIFFGMFIKLGAAPFHFWVPGVVSGLSWFCNFLLLTWQKVTPLFILCGFLDLSSLFLLMLVVMSSFFGGVGGVNQTSIRSIIAYSSILHMGWLLAASTVSLFYCILYFFIYSFILIFIIILLIKEESQMNKLFFSIYNWGGKMRFFLVFMIFSLGGMPPLLGFFGKWLVLMELVQLGFYLVSLVLVAGSMLSLYYYLVLCFSLVMSEEGESVKKEGAKSFVFMFGVFVNLFGLISLVGMTVFF